MGQLRCRSGGLVGGSSGVSREFFFRGVPRVWEQFALGSFGDRVGRTRAMGVCILFYSLFAAMGAYAQTQEQMLARYALDL